jgi:hypothetical protein
VEEAAVGESGEFVVAGHPLERGALPLQLLDVRRELIDAGLEAGSFGLGLRTSGSCRVDGEASPSATVESWQSAEARARFHGDDCHDDVMHPRRVSATLGACTFVVKESFLDLMH